MPFQLGRTYTRNQIGRELGGSKQAYLPNIDGRVTCGCFKPHEVNPDAPEEVLFGRPDDTPEIDRAADLVFQQGQNGDDIPVFLKRQVNEWEYVGQYLCIGITRDRRVVRRKLESYPARGNFSGVLRFEQV